MSYDRLPIPQMPSEGRSAATGRADSATEAFQRAEAIERQRLFEATAAAVEA